MKKCAKCGKPNWRNKLCPVCQKEWTTYKNRINWQANKKKKKLIESRGNHCEKCKEIKPLIVHHKVEIINGGTNDEANLMLVCKSCHDGFHAKRATKQW